MDERDKSRDCSVDVSVAIRIRPLNSREKAVGETGYAWGHNSSMIWTNTAAVAGSMAQMNDQRCASFSTGTSAGISAASTTYTFDHIFGQASITADVYNILASDLVESCMKGINGTIFAYGQTSSGKTHTMMGDESEPGIILLAVENIFRHISKNQDSEFLLRVSYLEIYNEVIRDLLEPGNINLKIHETINRDIFVGNLSEHVVSSAVQIKEILAIGEGNRHIGETNMNDKSSRSHTIFKMVVESRFRKDNADAVKVSQLNLVDLAGSERVGHTGAEGIRLKEGGHINKSLLTLSTVIGKLSDGGDKRHIPYRDSKLTRILQPSIGGNANTAIICTITPAQLHSDETHSTLRFASRAKTITNKPQVNELVSDETLLKRYKREIDQLKKQLVQLRTVESGQSSTENSMSQSPLPDASDLCIKPSISKKAVLEESLTGSKHGIQEKLLLNEKLDSLRHAILDSTCIGLEDISDRSLKKKARSNRRQTWFPGVSENASALTESEKIETQTWYQNLPEKAEIKIHCPRESNVMECTTVNADTQTHDCSLQLAVEKILDGQQLPSDDHYIQILQPLVACIQSYNLKVSFLTTKETQLQKVVEQLQNKLLQDETVVQQACENYGKQKSINKQLRLDLEDSKEQLTRTTKALEDSESACQSALDMCNIQKQASQCLHNEICDLKMSNSELKAQQEKTNTVLFGISTELQETIEQVHLLQLQEKKYLSTIEQQNNQLRHYCEKEKDQSSLIEQLQVQLQDFLQEKRDFESKTIEALQHSIMEKEAAEALASNFESKLFETISEMDTINIQNMDYIQRIVSEKDTAEMRVSDLEDKLAHTMQEKDELIDQNLKNAENSKLLKESAVARALELETQLKQAFFDREVLLAQNATEIQHFEKEKNLANTRVRDLESQLTQISSVVQQLQNEKNAIEERLLDSEMEFKHILEEKSLLIIQSTTNVQRFEAEKVAADDLVHELKGQLIQVMDEKETLINQGLDDVQRAISEKEIVECHMMDLETKLAQTLKEMETAATQSAIDIQHLEADKNSAEVCTLELQNQLIAMSHFIEIQLNHVYTWINQFEHNFYLQLQEKESYLRAKEVNIYKFMEQLCLLIDDAYTKFKRNCELEQSLEFAKKASTEIQKNITALQKRYEGNNVSKNCHVDWHEEIGQKHRLVNENFERLKRDHQPLCSDTLFILEQEKSTMSELFQLHQTMDTLFQEKFKFMDMNGILEKRLGDKLSHCQSISTELDALHYELQSTNSVYEKNRKDLEERIASLEIDLIERDQQICNLDRQYTQKCRDTETLRVLLEDERAEKENEISLFEQDAKQSTCDQTRLQNRANDLTNEIAALRDQIKEGSTKTDAFWSQKVHDLESKLAAAHIEYEQLQSSLQSLSIIMDAAKDVLKNRGFISFEDFESIYSSQTSTGYNVAFEFKKASRKVSELEQTLVERDKQIEDLKIRLRRSLESIDQETMIDRKLEHSVLPNNVSEIEPAALSAFSYLQNNRPIKSGQQSEEENTELILSLTKVAMLEQEVHMLKKKLQTMGMCLADEKGQKRQLELEIMRLENQIQLQKSKPVIQAAHIVADLENFDSLPMNTKSQQPVNQKLSVLSETVCNVNSKVDAHCQPEQNTTGTSTLSHKRTHGLTSDVTQGTRRPRLMNKADASQPVGRQREIGASGRQTRIKDKVLKEGQPGECNQQ
ncbi:hypothetical protein O5D80_006424 [Batrachochytrium dendrobatidis]|nr:hypothetical protein O5D80_006424 [Batrachochytrium dendrobatidis]